MLIPKSIVLVSLLSLSTYMAHGNIVTDCARTLIKIPIFIAKSMAHTGKFLAKPKTLLTAFGTAATIFCAIKLKSIYTRYNKENRLNDQLKQLVQEYYNITIDKSRTTQEKSADLAAIETRMQALIRSGANINNLSNAYRKLLPSPGGFTIYQQIFFPAHSFAMAIMGGNIDMINMFIRNGADCNLPRQIGQSALDLILQTIIYFDRPSQERQEIIDTIISHTNITHTDTYGNTYLHRLIHQAFYRDFRHANAKSYIDLAIRLLRAGAPLNAKNSRGQTARDLIPEFTQEDPCNPGLTEAQNQAAELFTTLFDSPRNRFVIACGLHARLGQESPISLVPQETLREICKLY